MSSVYYNIRTERQGDSALTINITVSFTDEDTPVDTSNTHKSFNIENVVMLRFKVSTEELQDKNNIIYSYSLSKHNSAKEKTIKVNIANKQIKYSAIDIDTPDTWSEWQPMGHTKLLVSKDRSCYSFATTFLITAYEDKKDLLRSKLYADTDFTDFRLSTPEGSVSVHKACMAAHSEVFKAMLTKEWNETVEGQINIKGATVQTLQQLKDYMYLGTVPKDGLQPLLLIARLYLIKDLEKQCIRKLAEMVSADELLSLVQFACDNNIPELVSAMLEITQCFIISKAYNLKMNSSEKQN